MDKQIYHIDAKITANAISISSQLIQQDEDGAVFSITLRDYIVNILNRSHPDIESEKNNEVLNIYLLGHRGEAGKAYELSSDLSPDKLAVAKEAIEIYNSLYGGSANKSAIYKHCVNFFI